MKEQFPINKQGFELTSFQKAPKLKVRTSMDENGQEQNGVGKIDSQNQFSGEQKLTSPIFGAPEEARETWEKLNKETGGEGLTPFMERQAARGIFPVVSGAEGPGGSGGLPSGGAPSPDSTPDTEAIDEIMEPGSTAPPAPLGTEAQHASSPVDERQIREAVTGGFPMGGVNNEWINEISKKDPLLAHDVHRLRQRSQQDPEFHFEAKGTSVDDINRLIKELRGASNLTQAVRVFGAIQGYARLAGRTVAKDMVDEYQKKIDQIEEVSNLNEFKMEAEDLAEKVKKHYHSYEGEEMSPSEVNSLEDLVWLIVNHEVDVWRPGGKYALIDIETDENGKTKEKLNRENLLAWVRNKMIFYHEFTPDGEINLFSDINIPTLYRPYSLHELVVTDPKYFKKESRLLEGIAEVGRIQEDALTNFEQRRVETDVSKDDKEYNNLKEEILYEVWLFNTVHNDDAGYRAIMGSDEQVPKTLVQQRYKNIWTQNENRLLRMLKMAGAQKKDKVFDQTLDKGKVFEMDQGKVGKIMQRSLLAYYYFPDEEMFEEVMGGKESAGRNAFYKKIVNGVFAKESEEAFKEAKKDKIKKLREGGRVEWEEKEVEPDLFGADKARFWDEIRKGNHNIDEEEFNALCNGDKKVFALKAWEYKFNEDYDRSKGWKGLVSLVETPGGEKKEVPITGSFERLNIYNAPKIEQQKVSIVRDAVRAAVGHALSQGEGEGYLFSEIDDKDYSDVKYGESWAFAFTYFSGISAQNDTNAIGFDKQVVVLNNKENRLRQAKGRGVYGIEDTISGIRKLGVNFWQGLRVKEEGRQKFDAMLLNLLQGGADCDGKKIDLSKDISNFNFEGNAERQYGIDHVSNSFKLAAFFEKHGMNFNQFISIDPITRKLLIDYEKADQIIRDGVWHDLRYAFDLPDLLWNKKLRFWMRGPDEEELEKDEEGKVILDEQGKPKIKIDKITGKPKTKRNLQFVTKTLEEMFFEEEVRDMEMYDSSEFLQGEYKHGRRARNVFSWLIAKEFQWHRKWTGGQERWRSDHVALASAYFKNMPLDAQEIEVVRNGKKVKEVVISAPFFNDKEWDKIEDTGGVSYNKLITEELGYDAGSGVVGGVGKGIGVFFKSSMQGFWDL